VTWSTAGAHLTVERDADGREIAKLRVAFVRITQELLDVLGTTTR
jgi:hypothetical protein